MAEGIISQLKTTGKKDSWNAVQTNVNKSAGKSAAYKKEVAPECYWAPLFNLGKKQYKELSLKTQLNLTVHGQFDRLTLPIIAVVAPRRAAATHWLAPLPPQQRTSLRPNRVSPGAGSLVT